MKRDADKIAKEAFEHLMRLPVENPERNRLSDIIRTAPEKLHAPCRKFLTLGAKYSARETFARKRNEIPTYESWCRSVGMSAADAKREADRARREWATIKEAQ